MNFDKPPKQEKIQEPPEEKETNQEQIDSFLEEISGLVDILSRSDQIQNILIGDDFMNVFRKLEIQKVLKSADQLFVAIREINEFLEHEDFVSGYKNFYTDGVGQLSNIFYELSELIAKMPVPEEHLIKSRNDLVESLNFRASKLRGWSE